jgi:cytochrome c553
VDVKAIAAMLLKSRPVMPPCTARMRILLTRLLAAAGLASVLPTQAQTPPARLGLCAACHGERGTAMATAKSTPNLAGQNLEYLRSAIKQYRSGARDVAAMRAATGMFSAAELDRVLQWYATQAPDRPAP